MLAYISMIRIKLIQTLISIRINSPLSKVYSHCVRRWVSVCWAPLFFSLPTNCEWCLHLSCGRACVTTSSLEVELCACLASNCIYGFFASLLSLFLLSLSAFGCCTIFGISVVHLLALFHLFISHFDFMALIWPRSNAALASPFMFVIIQFLVI